MFKSFEHSSHKLFFYNHINYIKSNYFYQAWIPISQEMVDAAFGTNKGTWLAHKYKRTDKWNVWKFKYTSPAGVKQRLICFTC